ncbi:MAG TPA: molybdenum cofactor guanylyltransferase [Candidatus Angelobacter sp.]|jgi:molybdopterin-guanine dinucleotide biosynthesis protein A|nr:molybdenum cofactor guanylyltransferase [Candidatus Angelobacter sp.]
MHSEVTGFVLAGGRSSRMGSNKAFLEFGGRLLIEHTKSILESVCGQVFILGQRNLYGGFGPCYEDIYPDCGPLSGIHAALSNTPTEFSLITAVDTPFIKAEFLDYIVDCAVKSSAMVTAPSVAGQVQPLCTVFRSGFLHIAESALKSGRFKVEPLFPREQTLILGEAELDRFALATEMFENLNTPEDLARARGRSISRYR